MDIVKDLEKLNCGTIIKNSSLKNYTTYKVGGSALAIVFPNNIEQLKQLILYIKKNKIKYKVIGNGSNLIFSDKPYNGIIIKLSNFNNLKIEDNIIKVEAGYSLVKLALETAKLGLTGLEFAAGIPATIGGSIFMNAGAYNFDMGYVVSDVLVLTPSLEIKRLTNKDLNFHYRSSILQTHPGLICLSATIVLKHGDKKTSLDLINDRKKRRISTQPLEYPSAGSVFRNPDNLYAGKLIEDLGLKGMQIGGAKISDKHANFIINTGNAKASDIISLINLVKDKVKKEYNIDLKLEQEIVE